MNKFLGYLIGFSCVGLVIFSIVGIVYLVSQENKVKSKEGFIYRLYIIEGCQYISYGSGGITHKGNCTNSIHKTK